MRYGRDTDHNSRLNQKTITGLTSGKHTSGRLNHDSPFSLFASLTLPSTSPRTSMLHGGAIYRINKSPSYPLMYAWRGLNRLTREIVRDVTPRLSLPAILRRSTAWETKMISLECTSLYTNIDILFRTRSRLFELSSAHYGCAALITRFTSLSFPYASISEWH